MSCFVNEYRQDEAYMQEAVKVTLMQYVFTPLNRVLAAVTAVLGIAVIILKPGGHWLYGIFLLLPVLTDPLIRSVRMKRELKIARTRMSTMNIPLNTVTRHTVTEEKCIIEPRRENAEKTLEIHMSAICDHYESKDYFFLQFGGGVFVPLDKNGFLEGTCEEFREFLKKFKKKNPFRPTCCSIFLLLMIVASSPLLFL